MKRSSLPHDVLKKIYGILYINDDLLRFFQSVVANDKNSADNTTKSILTLHSNDNQWTSRILSQQSVVALQTAQQSHRDLEGVYSKWASYVNKVDGLDQWIPTPNQSDACLKTLASNTNKRSKYYSLPRCKVSDICYKMLVEGSNFGYSLTHRVWLVLLARLGRSCTFFSPMLDRELTRRLCATAYSEAESIATNDFKLVDLMMEQMTLCSLDGHTEFLRRSWMKQILRFQYPRGCFGTIMYKPKRASGVIKISTHWKMFRKAELIGGECYGHVTAVAAATLASMVRSLLEIFY